MNGKNWIASLAMLAVASLSLLSCRISTGELARQVQADMVHIWTEQGFETRVTRDLVLVKINDTEYIGMLTILENGEEEQLTVTVLFDGTNFLWRTTTAEAVNRHDRFFVAEDLNFLLAVPESWTSAYRHDRLHRELVGGLPPPLNTRVRTFPNYLHRIMVGPEDSGFIPNMTFDVAPYSSSWRIYAFAHLVANRIQNEMEDTIILERGVFTTAGGMEGMRVKTHRDNYLQMFYIFDAGWADGWNRALIFTGSALIQSTVDYAKIFDASIRSLEFSFWW